MDIIKILNEVVRDINLASSVCLKRSIKGALKHLQLVEKKYKSRQFPTIKELEYDLKIIKKHLEGAIGASLGTLDPLLSELIDQIDELLDHLKNQYKNQSLLTNNYKQNIWNNKQNIWNNLPDL